MVIGYWLSVVFETEEVGCCAVGDFFDLLHGEGEGFGDALADVGDTRRLIESAAHRHGSEPRSIRFEEDMVESDDGERLAESRGILEGYDAVDSKPRVADSADTFYILLRAGEAVEDKGRERVGMLGDDAEGIVEAVATMDDDREMKFGSPEELLGEGEALLGAQGVIVIKVNADFADGGEISGEHIMHLPEDLTPIGGKFGGVQTDSEACIVGESAVEGSHIGDRREIDTGKNHATDAGGDSPLDSGITAIGEGIGHIDMSMRIGHAIRD